MESTCISGKHIFISVPEIETGGEKKRGVPASSLPYLNPIEGAVVKKYT